MNTLSLTEFYSDISTERHFFERHFSRFIREQLSNAATREEDAALLQELSALLLYAQSTGHVCLDLTNPPIYQKEDLFYSIQLPETGVILDALNRLEGDIIARAGSGLTSPLIYTKQERPLLYLYRYWKYERDLENRLKEMLASNSTQASQQPVPTELNLVAGSPQFKAVQDALKSRFSILSGGPGTGKTYTAVKVIVAKLLQNPDTKIALAAPTGKAANRLKESIAENIRKNAIDESLINRIKDLEAKTIHRLLETNYNTPYFKRNHDKPLEEDFVLVDEASMIDLPLMAKLLDAIDDGKNLLLIGDPYQLPSVEVGSIFGDMVNSEYVKPVVTTLTENFRATDSQGIVDLCNYINKGEDALTEALELLKSPPLCGTKSPFSGQPQLEWKNIEDASKLSDLVNSACRRYRELFSDSEHLHENSTKFRILTALKRGPFGSSTLNRKIKAGLKSNHELIIVIKNDPETELFNGDTGILSTKKDVTTATFANKSKAISVLRIPDYETAYAMTGHKAQGSEFDEVHIVLPADVNCPLLTREWLYTAVSRAKERVVIWGTPDVVRKCLYNKANRISGLLT